MTQAAVCRSVSRLEARLGVHVAGDLARGTLVEVLRQFGGASRPFTLLYAANRHMPHRVRVLVEFLLENLRDDGRVHRRSAKGT